MTDTALPVLSTQDLPHNQPTQDTTLQSTPLPDSSAEITQFIRQQNPKLTPAETVELTSIFKRISFLNSPNSDFGPSHIRLLSGLNRSVNTLREGGLPFDEAIRNSQSVWSLHDFYKDSGMGMPYVRKKEFDAINKHILNKTLCLNGALIFSFGLLPVMATHYIKKSSVLGLTRKRPAFLFGLFGCCMVFSPLFHLCENIKLDMKGSKQLMSTFDYSHPNMRVIYNRAIYKYANNNNNKTKPGKKRPSYEVEVAKEAVNEQTIQLSKDFDAWESYWPKLNNKFILGRGMD